MQYHVHIYAVVRVRVESVEAATQEEAIPLAEKKVDLHDIFANSRLSRESGVVNGEYTEEIVHYFVDEEGDPEYENSQPFHMCKEGLAVGFGGEEHDHREKPS